MSNDNEMEPAYRRMREVLDYAGQRRGEAIEALDGVLDVMRQARNQLDSVLRSESAMKEEYERITDEISAIISRVTMARDSLIGEEYDRERRRDV